MDWSVALLALGAFLGSLLVATRVIAWVTSLFLFLKGVAPVEAHGSQAFAFAPLLLHSGPWALAIAIAAVYYVASSSRPAHLWAVLFGLALAIASISIAVLVVRLRQRSARPAPLPITPERLRIIRRRFFWGNALFYSIVMTALLVSRSWAIFSHNIVLSIVLPAMIFVVSLGTGWLCAWFMWQWYGAALEAREKARKRRERSNAG